MGTVISWVVATIITLPIIVKSIWEWSFSAILVGVLLVVAIIFTYIE